MNFPGIIFYALCLMTNCKTRLSSLLISKENLIVVFENNICMAEKATYQQKLSLAEIRRVNLRTETF